MVYTSTPFMSTSNLATKSVVIRPAHHHECAAIHALFSHIMDTSFPQFSTAAKSSYLQSFTIEALQNRLQKTPHGLLSIAWQDDEALGLVSGTQPELGVATIIWLLVKPSQQNLRIGSHLLSHAFDFYRQQPCHKVKLTVPSEKARQFYLNNGMREEGYHANHWDNCNFWALARDL